MSKLAAISIAALISLTEKMQKSSPHREGGVAYWMDAKTDFGPYAIPGALRGDSSFVRKIDCSGFVRYTASKCSNEECITPDGSVQIHEWVKAVGLKEVDYAEAAKDPNSLYIAFIAPTMTKSGHVWWMQRGMTMESHGGKGVDRRDWNTPVLVNDCCACYLFPSKA